MNFDTSKTSLTEFSLDQHLPICVHDKEMDTRDNVEVGFGRGLPFATSFPVLLFSTLATKNFF